MSNASSSPSASELIVDFVGELYTIEPAQTFAFGRSADLDVDENPYMHRKVGRFDCRHDRWWLTNIGSSIAIEVYDRTTQSSATIMPGTEQVLPGNDIVVRFTAGSSTYEIEVRSGQAADATIETEAPTDTMMISDLPMTESQLQLVLALAEGKLLEPQAPLSIPASKEAAARLGWPITKFNRKLDNVCDKLTKAGVTGLKSTSYDIATDRRRRLVEHAIRSGLVDRSQLPLLENG